MRIRAAISLALMIVAGALSCIVSLFGIYSYIAVDLRSNLFISSLYCLLAFLCAPALFLVRPARRSVAVLAGMAFAYLAVYSVLDRRSCAELQYCGSVATTVLDTFRTNPVLLYFGAVIGSFGALLADGGLRGNADRG